MLSANEGAGWWLFHCCGCLSHKVLEPDSPAPRNEKKGGLFFENEKSMKACPHFAKVMQIQQHAHTHTEEAWLGFFL